MSAVKNKMATKKEIAILDNHVLAVAIEGAVKDWAAYIGAVQGKNFEEEAQQIAEHGTKLPRKIAELLFPSFRNLRWRY